MTWVKDLLDTTLKAQSTKKKKLREGILGRLQSRKHQESVSPLRQQIHWPNLFNVTIFELWNLLKACYFQGNPWTVNCY